MQIKPLSSNSARYYFSKDNYYFTGELSTHWHGQSAERLVLGESVGLEQLDMILSGILPTGDIVGLKSTSGEIKHRGGYDLTFSAPKSVSYLALVAGHKEFIELHEKAVQKVLGIIEREGAEARKMSEDGMTYEKTKNLAFATILHDTSREQDPQLHTHALLMNLTERLDGKWRALASDMLKKHGTMEWIMANQLYLGLVYRSEIAMGLTGMGLEIEHTGDAHGLFEIKHFNPDLLTTHSKRRTQIESEVETMRSSTLKAHDLATQTTRKYKKTTDPETLKAKWTTESMALGIDPSSYLADLKQITNTPKTVDNPGLERENPVLDAIAHLEGRRLSFSYQDVLQASLYFSIGTSSYDTLTQGIEREIKSGHLIALDDKENRLTTSGLIAKEKQLVEQLNNYAPKKRGIPTEDKTNAKSSEPITVQETVSQALKDKQGLVRIQQQSIVSKDVLLALIDHAANANTTIRVLSPTRLLAKSVNDATYKTPENLWQWLVSIGKSDIAETVSGFNHQHQSEHLLPFFKFRKGSEMIIVDDVGRVAPDELHQLLSIATGRKAKLIFLEKSEGLTGFKSDVPGLLDKASVKTYLAYDKPQLNTAISLHEARDKVTRLNLAATEYTKLTHQERLRTAIFTLSKAESQEVNQQVREQLKESGELSVKEKEIKILLPVSLTDIEKKTTKCYQPDWVLRHTSHGKTQQLTIMSVNENKQHLIVREESGLMYDLPTKSITPKTQLYETHLLPVSIGERLISTGNMHAHGVKTGADYEVTDFTRHGIKLKTGSKSIHVLTTGHLPFAYSYAKNIHAHNHKTVDHTILTMPSYALNKNIMALGSESSRQSLTVITDDVEKAKRHAEKLSVNSSAIAITLSAAKGVEIINGQTTVDLLQRLDQAIAKLTAEKPTITAREKALLFAISHLSEREAVFSKHELLTVALQKAMGVANLEGLEQALTSDLRDGQLIAAPNGMLMTRESLAFEQQILSTVRTGKNTVIPLLDDVTANDKLSAYALTEGQKEACHLIATTSDRFIMIQGFAGTGKTTMTKSAIDVIQQAVHLSDKPLAIVAVAPTHQAVKEMRALGIEAQTLKSFLIEQEQNPTLNENSLVLLDESSMVSNRDAAKLISQIHESSSRCVLLGDVSQHQSIESGKPSDILLQEGTVSVAFMDNLVRQKILDYREAVETLIKGDTDKALSQLAKLPLNGIEREGSHPVFEQIKTSVVEVFDTNKDRTPDTRSTSDTIDRIVNETPISMAVFDYLSRTPECRDNTIVVIHENKHREHANQLIREGLIEKSALGRENQSFGRLLSTNYTTAALYQMETFSNLLKESETYFLKKNNEYYKVTGVDKASHVVELRDEQGKSSLFLPEKENQDWKIELFKAAPGQVSVGEKIHFKKSDKSLARYANERLVVTEVGEKAFTVKDTTGQTHVLHKNELKDSHWDYSYTSTSYSIQGSSSPFVIGVASTENKKTNHFRSFYIMVSRGSLHAMIYTDNYKELQAQLAVTPNKTSALEALGCIPTTMNSKVTDGQKIPAIRTRVHDTNQRPFLDVERVVQHLTLDTERVVESLLGAPNPHLSSKKELRYGSKGSLSICLQGDKRGTWFNFETGEKGNLLHMIQTELNLDFKTSLNYAATLTGDDLKKIMPVAIKIKAVQDNEIEKKQSKTGAYAQQLEKESTSIAGTVAETYLKEIREITHVHGQNIRFHPKVYTGKNEDVKYKPALLCIARDKMHQVQSVQAIYLDEHTAKKAELSIQKKTFGSISGTGVILNKGENEQAVTYITEGVETGLSVRDAVRNERVIAVLGKQNMASIDVSLLTNKIVLCLDNDGKSIHKDRIIRQTIERLTHLGKTVEIAIPSKQGDFNDIIKSNGVSGVISVLNKSFKAETLYENTCKFSMSVNQIQNAIERSSKENNLEVMPIKPHVVEQIKTEKRLNFEIG